MGTGAHILPFQLKQKSIFQSIKMKFVGGLVFMVLIFCKSTLMFYSANETIFLTFLQFNFNIYFYPGRSDLMWTIQPCDIPTGCTECVCPILENGSNVLMDATDRCRELFPKPQVFNILLITWSSFTWVVHIWRGWDSTSSYPLVTSKNSWKNSRFLSNKTKKLTKIVNRKPKINQKKLGHYELVLFLPSKIHEKSRISIK